MFHIQSGNSKSPRHISSHDSSHGSPYAILMNIKVSAPPNEPVFRYPFSSLYLHSWFSCQSRSRFSCSSSNLKQIMWQPPCNSGLISSPGTCPMVICRLYSLGRESFLPYPYPALLFLQSFPTGRPLFSGSLKWSLPLSFIIQGYSIAPWDTIFLNGYFLYSQHGKPQKLDDFPKSQNNTATISDEKGCCVTQFISFGFSETLVMIGDLHSCPSRTSQLLFGIIATILFRMKAGSFGTKCGDTKR